MPLKRRRTYSLPALIATLVLIGLVQWFDITLPLNQSSGTVPEGLYQVERVIDGDTIVVFDGTKNETVRLIGINTPETVDPRRPVECFGKEASEVAHRLLDNARVRLEFDASQGERDKYQRVLAYVFLEDGTFFNKYMIEEGYAYEYTYNIPYVYQEEFTQAQQLAETNGKGLWADGTCVTE